MIRKANYLLRFDIKYNIAKNVIYGFVRTIKELSTLDELTD